VLVSVPVFTHNLCVCVCVCVQFCCFMGFLLLRLILFGLLDTRRWIKPENTLLLMDNVSQDKKCLEAAHVRFLGGQYVEWL
jgi:hypothetical protein